MSMDMVYEKEIHISIDPVSMKEMVEYSSPVLSKPPTANKPLSSLQKKYKFLSTSLPNSACSSPRGGLVKRKAKDHHEATSLARQHSVALSRLVLLRDKHLERSKSCGQGRSSGAYDELDLWLTTSNTSTYTSSVDGTPKAQNKTSHEQKKTNIDDDFKCGALCLFLPGFGKGKPVRTRREEMGHIISKRVSFEKFECGSWRSSGILNSDFPSNHYFDLPLELIRTSVNDATLPVSSAFVFDKDVKGVLKTRAGERKSNDRHHIRFSTSSPASSPPSCMTPRTHKAQEDFHSFLEAQSA